MKKSEICLGKSYLMNGKEYYYLGKLKYLGSTKDLAFKMIEEMVFLNIEEKKETYKIIKPKDLEKESIDFINELDANDKFLNFLFEKDRELKIKSANLEVEISNLLLNPVIISYAKEKNITCYKKLIEELHFYLLNEIKLNPGVIYWNKYEENSSEYRKEIIQSYVLFLYKTKYHYMNQKEINNLSKTKIENYLFKEDFYKVIINEIEKVKNNKIEIKIFKNLLTNSDASYEEFINKYNENKDKKIDFKKAITDSKGVLPDFKEAYKERKTNLIDTKEIIKSDFEMYYLIGLFGNGIYYFGSLYSLLEIEEIHENDFIKDLYKIN